MPIFDGSQADHYHRQNRIFVTRRIIAEITDSVERAKWFQAPKVLLQCHRRAYELGNITKPDAVKLLQTLKLTSAHNILLVGATFGWLAEVLIALGISVTCIEDSTWVQSVKDTDEAGDIEAALDLAGVTSDHAMRQQFFDKLIAGPRAREVILDEDGMTRDSRQRIRNKGTFTHIITKNVLAWRHDDECVALSDALHQINALAQVVHFVAGYDDKSAMAPEPEPVLNWKRVVGNAPVNSRLTDKPWYTTNSWPALLPNDTFVGV